MSETKLATVGTYLTSVDADVARGVLESAGIECMVRSDDCGGQYPSLLRVDVLVRAGDVPRAMEVLRVVADPPRDRR
jgi:Putative prokaryotic signal transducing protein